MEPFFKDTYFYQIRRLEDKIKALEQKVSDPEGLVKKTKLFFRDNMGCLLFVYATPVVIHFVYGLGIGYSILIAIGSILILAYLVKLLLKKILIPFYVKCSLKVLKRRLFRALSKLKKLNRKREAERRVYERQYEKYAVRKGGEINLEWCKTLALLDDLKNNYLVDKPILTENSLQSEKWEIYKSKISSLKLDYDKRIKFDRLLKENLLKHKLYYESRIETKNDPYSREDTDFYSGRSLSVRSRYLPKKSYSQPIKSFLKMVTSSEKVNYEYANKTTLGAKGEEFIMKHELEKILKDYPKNRKYPIHISKLYGDKPGFDILSIDSKRKPLLLEVKTTTKGKSTPFYLTRNELQKLDSYERNYYVVRVYNFDIESGKGEIEYIDSEKLKSLYRLESELYKISHSTNKKEIS